jgi:hypothetical protein
MKQTEKLGKKMSKIKQKDLSVVFATRDDDYGLGANTRLVRSIKNLQKIFKKKGINGEILVVDWNSSAGRSIESILKSAKIKHVRLLVVSPELAEPAVLKHGRPFVEFVAKNIGVSRSFGNQVVVTNSDILHSTALIEASIKRPDVDRSFLRVDRTDFHYGKLGLKVPLMVHVRHGANEADPISVKTSLFRHKPHSLPLDGERVVGSLIIGPPGGSSDHYLRGLHTNASGDFIAAPIESWLSLKGFREDQWTTTHGDSVMVSRLVGLGLSQIILTGNNHALHEDHPRPADRGVAWTEEMWPELRVKLNEFSRGGGTVPTHDFGPSAQISEEIFL